jgi:hypothetical protein
MEEIDDEPLHVQRVSALDVGKGALEACIRVPGETSVRRRAQEVRSSARPSGRSCRWPTGCAAIGWRRW